MIGSFIAIFNVLFRNDTIFDNILGGTRIGSGQYDEIEVFGGSFGFRATDRVTQNFLTSRGASDLRLRAERRSVRTLHTIRCCPGTRIPNFYH